MPREQFLQQCRIQGTYHRPPIRLCKICNSEFPARSANAVLCASPECRKKHRHAYELRRSPRKRKQRYDPAKQKLYREKHRAKRAAYRRVWKKTPAGKAHRRRYEKGRRARQREKINQRSNRRRKERLCSDPAFRAMERKRARTRYAKVMQDPEVRKRERIRWRDKWRKKHGWTGHDRRFKESTS